MNHAEIAKMLHEFLSAFGFVAMARDVLTETEWPRLQQYARIVLKNAPEASKIAMKSRFSTLRLV